MKLIVGLGNPGKKYKNTRHNTGFMFVDRIAKDVNATFTLDAAKKCELANAVIGNEKAIIIKPQTYMNLSGESVLAVANYFKIETKDILVFHDDMDLDVGHIRIRQTGSSAGHKGMQNIMDLLGTKDIARVRVGISKPVGELVINYVLEDFYKDEKISLELLMDKATNIATDFNVLSFDDLMCKYNR